jgi:two-component system phosphate regulon response regulator OmpR
MKGSDMSNRPSRIVVVDDDPRIQKMLVDAFRSESFEAHMAGDAATMLRIVGRMDIDIVALDIGLPGEDGLSALRHLRAFSDVPVVLITGRSDTVDKVLGLELGADDYICKPFHIRELVARVRAVLRRRDAAGRPMVGREVEEALGIEGWRIDLVTRQVTDPDGAVKDLTGAEFDLLKLFVTNPNRVLSRDQIMDRLKGREWSPYDRTIDMQVRRLRSKIEADPARPKWIRTVRGAGYVFSAKVSALRPRAASSAPPIAVREGAGV